MKILKWLRDIREASGDDEVEAFMVFSILLSLTVAVGLIVYEEPVVLPIAGVVYLLYRVYKAI